MHVLLHLDVNEATDDERSELLINPTEELPTGGLFASTDEDDDWGSL